MEKEVELFDLPRDAFEEKIHRWIISPDVAQRREVTWLTFRQAISILARLIWTLGQRVKKLEREE